ncbi:MAG: hypothetical protein ACP5NW_05355 [Candidatus Woesearchaeota archaeon]
MGKNPTSIDDMEIFDIISDLNRRPYIQTVLCCSGHLLWENRNGLNLPYIEYYLSDKKGYDLTRRIEEQISKELPSKNPRIIPKIEYYKDSSLRFSGLYEGEYTISEQQIRSAVNHFWDSFRRGMKE